MRFFRRRLDVPEVREAPDNDQHGPSWMIADEWTERLAIYERQGRSPSQIADVRRHLERRGPPPALAEVKATASREGYVARQEYMANELELEALRLGPDGFPDARLRLVRNRMLVVTPLGWVNHRSRTSYRAGLFAFIVRGTAHNMAAATAGDFSPGTPIRLVREPDNIHDPNAVAVYAGRARAKSGYVPKAQAKRIARLLDTGVDLVAVSVRGSKPGSHEVNPNILACERSLYDHLVRE